MGAHIGCALCGDTLIEHIVESGDLVLVQCFRHYEVALEVEQVSFLVVHWLLPTGWRITVSSHAILWTYSQSKL